MVVLYTFINIFCNMLLAKVNSKLYVCIDPCSSLGRFSTVKTKSKSDCVICSNRWYILHYTVTLFCAYQMLFGWPFPFFFVSIYQCIYLYLSTCVLAHCSLNSVIFNSLEPYNRGETIQKAQSQHNKHTKCVKNTSVHLKSVLYCTSSTDGCIKKRTICVIFGTTDKIVFLGQQIWCYF